MNRTLKVVLPVVLVAFLAATVLAQDAPKKKKRGKKAQQTGPIAQLMKQLKTIDLKEEQSERINKLIEQVKPKLAELAPAAKITPEQRTAMTEARKKAQAEGKTPKETRDATRAAGKLTDEQAKAADQIQKLMRDLRQEIGEVLTPEQREATKIGIQKKGGKKKNK